MELFRIDDVPAGVLTVLDEQPDLPHSLPSVVTAEWLDERLQNVAVGMRIDAAMFVDKILRSRQAGLPPRGLSAGDILTTDEASAYLRRSPSWLLRQSDIPFVKGVPNTYRRKDLDDWFERHKSAIRVQ